MSSKAGAGISHTIARGLVLVTLALPASGAAAPPPRLLYAEPIASAWRPAPEARPVSPAAGAGRGTLEFEAFGRAFTVALAPNERLRPASGAYAVEAGSLAGAPGSWARITRRGDELIGILFDGHEYFGIEPAAGVSEFLDPALRLAPRGNVIYRLADLLLDPGVLSCEIAVPEGTRVTAAAAVALLGSELQAKQTLAAQGPELQIRIAPVADYEFASRYGGGAESEVMSRLNIVDGIFSEQVGIDVAAGAPTVFRSTAAPYPFGDDSSAGLLGQISDYRLASHDGFGLTHLFTNRALGSGLVGTAWQGAVCFPREGAGLSTSAGLTRTASALVAAHEIGHNFGAPHDGEPGSACESTPPDWLMAAQNPGGSSTFSSCSLDRIAAVVESATSLFPSCLVPLSDFDVSVVAPPDLAGTSGTMIEALLTVQNLGTESATAVSLRLTAPAGLAIQGIRHDAGFCDYGADELSCDLPELAAGATWLVTVEIGAMEPGNYAFTTRVAAETDRIAANDLASLAITVRGVATPGTGGGGGGSAGIAGLALLGISAARRLTGR